MTTTGIGKNASTVRHRTIFIGTDQRGHDYVLKTERAQDEVVVIDAGERVLVDALDGLRVEHVVATVAEEIGWDSIEFGWRAHNKRVPLKHA